MRWYILRALLQKEFARHLANRGGIALALLLVAAAVLLSVFAPQEGKALTSAYLSAALQVLGPTLRYVGQWHDQAGAVLILAGVTWVETRR